MKPVVLDASALIAWLLNDHPSAAACVETAIERRGEAPLIAPILLRAEVANALIVAVRRGRISAAQAQQAAAFADGLPIEFDPQAAGVGALLMAASSHGLTACDAIYLQLAVLSGGSLLTADSALAAAAQRAGITVQGAELNP